MSAAALSCELMRPVLPFMRKTVVNPSETIDYRTEALARSSRQPAAAPAQLLLIQDDAAELAEQLRRAFPAPEYRVRVAGCGPSGLRHVAADSPDVVILELGPTGSSGQEILRQIREIDARVPVICITGVRRGDVAIEAMRHGAYDCLFKPVEMTVLQRTIAGALEVARRMRQSAVHAEPAVDPELDGTFVGACPAMREVYKAIGRVAAQNVPVLITGESGTGKELVARAIVQYGPRSKAAFLALNCAAIPENLLESEVFGHEKGAFTGADRRRIGRFEQCHGGTLMLDEIGDMPAALQGKILRVLQEQAFERVGGSEMVRTDVRLIAATHRDLKAMSEEGSFRPDLYYRLGVFTIHLPPLRERREDVPMLVRHYVRRFNRELGREVYEVAPEALERLCGYTWPGNVRELQSVLKQALMRATGPVLLPAFLPELPGRPSGLGPQTPAGADVGPETFIRQRLGPDAQDLYAEAHRGLDQTLLPHVLQYTGGNQNQAARLLGIARQTLRLKLRDLGLHVTHSVETDDA